MRRNGTLAGIAAVAMLATLLTACGSSEARLAKPDFTSKMNALCKTREKALGYLDNVNVFAANGAAKNWGKAKAPIDDFLNGVKDLKPPKDAQKVYDNYVDTVEGVQGQVDDLITAGKAGNQKLYSQDLVKLFRTTDAADRSMDSYGTKDCFDEENAFPPDEKPAAGATKVDVGAKEYQFTLPTTVKAGKTAFQLTDNGNEIHMLGISKLKDGHTFQELQQFVTTSDDDPSQKGLTDDVAAGAIAAPGESKYLNADLSAGTYAVYCFISAPDGTPHFKKGMLAKFSVS